jgi:ribosome-associated translation inhibitor RaiA
MMAAAHLRMLVPLQISFRNGTNSDAACERIRHHVAKLEDVSPRIIACHVTVDVPHRHHRHGRHYSVRIALHVPRRRVMVTRDPAQNENRNDPYAAIDEAFGEAARQLKERQRKCRRSELPGA